MSQARPIADRYPFTCPKGPDPLRKPPNLVRPALAREYGVSRATVYNVRWTEVDVIAVDDLYRQHGKPLDASHSDVVALARRLERIPTAVAARINLHGAHTEPGYPGTRWHFTKLDRKAADREVAEKETR